ncbi:MAG: hypothetical protein M3T49_06755, partial [Candidatus Eremiobacteraeota bacterium]|nr:hypothetical protein [Candidatus Eremiobacteraeota bacterium]
MNIMRMRFASSLTIAALALSACSGPSAVMPLRTGQTTAPNSIARFTITVPSAVHALSVGRAPQYVSASTQSVSIAVDGAANPTIANLSASSPGCATPAGAALNCKLSVVAPVGSDTFSVVTYDRANGSGKALSKAAISATITANHLNNIGLILNGIVASIQLALSNPAPRQGTALSIGLTVDAMDADGNVIIGPGIYDNGP